MIKILTIIAFLISCNSAKNKISKSNKDFSSNKTNKYYSTELISIPQNISSQVGGLDKLDDGRLVVAFHSGEVAFYSPYTKKWHLYAQGLHEILGVIAHSPDNIVVVQRPEITRLKDTDGDQIADSYETISDKFGLTGNYHEFNFGAIQDSEGNYYISLNVASNLKPAWKEIRGTWSSIGLPREKFYTQNWKEIKKQAGRMYSRVPYRGWILKVSPQGKTTPIASGFRSPNGLGIDDKGNILVTDNQGDWLATSPLYHIKKGSFYGHPASITWEKNWPKINPLKVDSKIFDAIRKRPSGIFPQGTYASSPTKPLYIKDNRIGDFQGQWLIGEMSSPKILRFIPDMIDGQMQGAMLIHFNDNKIGGGNHRLLWGKDNDLWIGKIHLKWAGSYGVKRVIFHNVKQQTIKSVRLVANNIFRLSFAEKLKQTFTKEQIKAERFSYNYWKKYGSEQINLKKIKIHKIKKINATTFDIYLDNLEEKFYYEVKIDLPLSSKKFVYTLNKLPNLSSKIKQNISPDIFAKETQIKNWWKNKQKDIQQYKKKINMDVAKLEKKYQWQYLFDGTLESAKKNFIWKNKWLVEDNKLIIKRKRKMGILYSKKEYKNFVLDLDVKFNSDNVNGGIFYYASKKRTFEFQLCDNQYRQQKTALHRIGALYDIVKNPYNDLVKQNDWNRVRIIAYNGQIEHYLNNKLLFSINTNEKEFHGKFATSKYFRGKINFPTNGKFALQDHGDSDFSFRNIRVLDLEK